MIPLGERAYVKGEAWVGRNVDDLRGGSTQGVSTSGHEIRATGFWVEVGSKIGDWGKAHFGYTEDNPDNGHVDPVGGGAAPGGISGIQRNSHWFAGLDIIRYNPVVFGCEYYYWKTEWKDLPGGHANRFKLYVAYKF